MVSAMRLERKGTGEKKTDPAERAGSGSSKKRGRDTPGMDPRATIVGLTDRKTGVLHGSKSP